MAQTAKEADFDLNISNALLARLDRQVARGGFAALALNARSGFVFWMAAEVDTPKTAMQLFIHAPDRWGSVTMWKVAPSSIERGLRTVAGHMGFSKAGVFLETLEGTSSQYAHLYFLGMDRMRPVYATHDTSCFDFTLGRIWQELGFRTALDPGFLCAENELQQKIQDLFVRLIGQRQS
jgi:hypothetical protein